MLVEKCFNGHEFYVPEEMAVVFCGAIRVNAYFASYSSWQKEARKLYSQRGIDVIEQVAQDFVDFPELGVDTKALMIVQRTESLTVPDGIVRSYYGDRYYMVPKEMQAEFENACSHLFYGSCAQQWMDRAVKQFGEDIAKELWHQAFNFMAEENYTVEYEKLKNMLKEYKIAG